MNTFRRKPQLIKIGQKYRAIYVKAQLRFIFACDIKSPQKHTLQATLYQAVWIAKGL
jgi:hypothetical protein